MRPRELSNGRQQKIELKPVKALKACTSVLLADVVFMDCEETNVGANN